MLQPAAGAQNIGLVIGPCEKRKRRRRRKRKTMRRRRRRRKRRKRMRRKRKICIACNNNLAKNNNIGRSVGFCICSFE